MNSHMKHESTHLPEKLQKRLMSFQHEGVQFALQKNGRCLIADEMGLGKTLQAISVAYFYKDDWPLLIIVPSSLRYSWVEELEKWLPEIHPHSMNLIQSGTDISAIASAEITLVTYGLLRHPASAVLKDALLKQNFKVVIADESHYIKNRKAVTTKYIVPLLQASRHKILLTGTPALGRPEELFPQLNALCPEKFGNWTAFAKRFCDARWQWMGRQKRWRTDGASNLEELHHLVATVMIRRLKKDVLTQLPPKRRQRITFDLKESTFKKDMDRTWMEMNKLLRASNTTMMDTMTSDPGRQEIPTIFEIRKLIGELYRQTCKAKIGPVKEYIKMQCANEGVKLLIFAYHHDMMNGIQEQLWDDGVKFIRIDGSVPPSDRARFVTQFQRDPDTRVAILSIKAAGVGLTFTAATLVVFAELHWTPGELQQCEDRAHRIGQKSTVHVHYLVAKGTLDEWVWTALSRKTTVVTTTLNGQTQHLNMAQGSEESSMLLSNAEAWTPPTNSTHNILKFFQTQQPSDQRSITDFFAAGATPLRKRKRQLSSGCAYKQNDSADLFSGVDSSQDLFSSDSDLLHKNDNTTSSAEHEDGSQRSAIEVIRVDSESDSEDFVQEKSYNNILLNRSVGSGSGSDKKKNLQKTEKSRNRRTSNSNKGSSRKSPSSLDQTPKSQLSKFLVTKFSKTTSPSCDASDSLVKTPKSSQNRSTLYKSKSTGWNCDTCTYLNHGEMKYCEMCETPKKKMIKDDRFSKTKCGGSLFRETAHSSLEIDSDTEDSVNHISETTVTTGNEISDSSLGDIDDSTLTSDEAIVTISNITSDSSVERVSSRTRGKNDVAGNVDRNTGILRKSEIFDSEERVNTDSLKKQSESSESDDIVYKISETSFSSMDSRLACTKVKKKETEKDICEDLTECDNNRVMDKSRSSMPVIDQSDSDSDTIDGSTLTPSNEQTASFDSQETYKTASSVGNTQKSLGSTKCTSPVNIWFCSDCNFRNECSDDFCQQCLMEKPKDSASVAADILHSAELLSTKGSSTSDGREWECPKCCHVNCGEDSDCDECFTKKPKDTPSKETGAEEESRTVNLDEIEVFEIFQYCVSKNTDRVYLHDKDDESLGINFIPLDVEMGNVEELPDLLLHPKNLRLVQRFVREWNSLTATKKSVVTRNGGLFTSPCLAYENIKSGRQSSTQRYKTKDDIAIASLNKAQEIGGSVRLVTTSKSKSLTNSPAINNNNQVVRSDVKAKPKHSKSLIQHFKGTMQALDNCGTPLCLQCQSPCSNSLLDEDSSPENTRATRFCSSSCMDEYWVKMHRDYSKKKVYEQEHGICQMCGLDAQDFFNRIRSTKDLKKRATLIQESIYKSLKSETKESMVKQPFQGLFWQVDHIQAVMDGGGQCDVDNLRTLCTMCHRTVTSEQNKRKSQQRRLSVAASCGNIKMFFKPN